MNFNQLDLTSPLCRALADTGYSSTTLIQSKAIPPILDGKDVLGCARTGTGKTGAFAIPILQKLQNSKKSTSIRTLVLTPTRELAIQVDQSFKVYAKYLPLRSLAIYGGVPQNKQVSVLKKGVDILVATPGRLMDLMRQGFINLSALKILVLDEADRMLDMGFVNDIKRILKQVPKQRQTLLFSATMPKEIRAFSHSIMKQPVEITVAPVSSPAKTVEQSVYFVENKEKDNVLFHLLKTTPLDRSLIFTRTKHRADKLVKKLNKIGINAAAIHGNKSQNARQRALENFKCSNISILVATDIASRGIDIDDLPLVVNYDLPEVAETYVHRIGRTGRAGKRGTAISFCDNEHIKQFKNIQKLMGTQISTNSIKKSFLKQHVN